MRAVIGTAGNMIWFAWAVSTAFAMVGRRYGNPKVWIFRRLAQALRPLSLPALIAVFGVRYADRRPSTMDIIVAGYLFWVWWVAYHDDDDDDWGRRLRRKAKDLIRQLGARLVVVPAR